MYKAIKDLWKKPKENLGELYKQRLIEFRHENVITKIERPTRLDKARSLGYKPKKGVVLYRVRVKSGGRFREQRKKGRRSRTQRRRKIVGMSYQWIAENKAQKKHKNLEVLNSYFVIKDGLHKWYEVIMVDPSNPHIKADKKMNWISKGTNRGRAFRGLTSIGKRSRGLRVKGKNKRFAKEDHLRN